MVKYFCDRCSREVPSNSHFTTVVIPQHPKNGARSYDVCRNCLEQIQMFVATPPPQVRASVR